MTGMPTIQHSGDEWTALRIEDGKYVWPIEEYLARTNHSPYEAQIILKLNPNGKREDLLPIMSEEHLAYNRIRQFAKITSTYRDYEFSANMYQFGIALRLTHKETSGIYKNVYWSELESDPENADFVNDQFDILHKILAEEMKRNNSND